MTKDILGRRFNFPDEVEQDFLTAIDPPIDLGHRVKLIKDRGEYSRLFTRPGRDLLWINQSHLVPLKVGIRYY